MVGHTHEDVDQHFSVLSRYLRKNPAPSLESVLHAVSIGIRIAINRLLGMEHAVRVSDNNLTYTFNIKHWIAPHLDLSH